MSVGKLVKQLAGESLIYGVAGTASKVVALALIPVYSRAFTPEEFGEVTLVIVMTGLLSSMAVLGLENASARWYYDSNDQRDRQTTISSSFWTQVVAAAFVATAGLLLADWTSALVLGQPSRAPIIRVAVLALPFLAAARTFGLWLRLQRRAWAASLFTGGQLIAEVVLVVLLVLVWKTGVPGLFGAKLLAAVLVSLPGLFIFRGWITPQAFSAARLMPMLRYGLPMVPAALGISLMAYADRIFLRVYCDPSEVGLYGVAALVASGVTLLTAAFATAWGPFAFSILNDEECSRVYSAVLDMYSLLGCALCTAIALFAPYIVRALCTEQYFPAASSVGILGFALFANGARVIATLGCTIVKRPLPSVLAVVIGVMINVALNVMLVPHFGRDGAAVATLVAYTCSVAYLFAASQSLYRIPYRWHVAMACFGLSSIVMLVDRSLLLESQVLGVMLRFAMLALFLPLGMSLGVVKAYHVRQLCRVWPVRQGLATAKK